MRVASLLLALTAAPAVRAAPTGRTKHLHELEADLHELEKMHEFVFGRSFDKTNPNVCSRTRRTCEDATDHILDRDKNPTDDECAKYRTMDDSGEYIVCRKAYFSMGCASQRGWQRLEADAKIFCNDLVGAPQLRQYLTQRPRRGRVL